MKKLLFSLLVLLIILINIKSQAFDVTPIYPYCINVSALIANLEDYNEDYLYFGDEFNDTCSKGDEDSKYYVFNSDINIINSKNLLYYAKMKRDQGPYGIELQEIKNLDYKPINSLKTKKEKSNGNSYSQYYEIKKEDEEKNIVLFRIAKNGNKEGSVSIETLSGKPDFVLDDGEEEESEPDPDKFIKVNSSNYLYKRNFVLLYLLFLFGFCG